MGLDNRQVLVVSLSTLFFFFFYSASADVPEDLLHALPPFAASSPASTPVSSSSPAEEEPEPSRVINANNNVADPFLTSACRGTDYPDLCLSSLQPYLNGKADLFTILEQEIKASKDRAISVSAMALKMAQDPRTDAETASLLMDCNEMYSTALDNFQQAEDAMKTRDIGTVNSMLSAGLADFGTCDDMASETPGVQEMLFSREDAPLQHLSSNCLAIASMIKW